MVTRRQHSHSHIGRGQLGGIMHGHTRRSTMLCCLPILTIDLNLYIYVITVTIIDSIDYLGKT